MRPTPRSWLVVALVLAALAGCAAGGASVSVGGPPRCDRNGDEDQRREC